MILFLTTTLLLSNESFGADVFIEVVETNGAKLEIGTIHAIPEIKKALSQSPDSDLPDSESNSEAEPAKTEKTTSAQTHHISQHGEEYHPRVIPARVGDSIIISNEDKIKHHSYSFSPTKPFDTPLIGRASLDPIKFDKPGLVTIGCNIHDWMVSFVNIADTPYYTTIDDGEALLEKLEPGTYFLKIWHPRIRSKDRRKKFKIVVGEKSKKFKIKVSLKNKKRKKRRRWNSNALSLSFFSFSSRFL